MSIKVGVIGLGYWGPNYIRNFLRHNATEIVWGCDLSKEVLDKNKKFYPQLKFTTNYEYLLKDQGLDLIAIATPPETHYKIAKNVLEANKHVLIAKPLAVSLSEANQLQEIAKKKNLLLQGDLTYLYTDAIKTLKALLEKKTLGQPLYYDSIRANLGLIQNHVNVIWDLAPHDFSIINYLFDVKPLKVFAVASKHHENSKGEEIAHITVKYSNNFIAHIHVSWLSPIKLRTILIGGSEKMLLFDDVEPDEKIKVYDKGVAISPESITPFKPAYRSGDILIPKLNQEEALYNEIEDIVKQINSCQISYKNAFMNIEVIKLLEACDKSLKTNSPVSVT